MSRLRSALVILTLAIVAACGDDSTGPTNASVAGTYQASDITLTLTGGPPQDGLGLGFSVDVVLTPQGTTTGTLVTPAPFTEDGVDDDVIDLTGTFTIDGNTLTFHGQGDSYFPEVPWTIGDGTLSMTLTESEGTIAVTLTRS